MPPRVALAARAQGKYDEFHRAMMAVKGDDRRGQRCARTAAGVGIDMDKLNAAIDGARDRARHRQRTTRWPQALDIEGTPAFVVGDTLLPGAADIDTLRQAVAKVRKGG